MNDNEFAEGKKQRIFLKLINFIKNIFKPDKALPAPNVFYEEIPNINSIFDDTNIQNIQEDSELLDLQSKFENNEIALSELSDTDLNNLNSLYLRQIEALNRQLNKTTF